jgi:hypothetical protein
MRAEVGVIDAPTSALSPSVRRLAQTRLAVTVAASVVVVVAACVMTDRASCRRAQQGMVACEMAGDAADHRAAEAARLGRAREGDGGRKAGDHR